MQWYWCCLHTKRQRIQAFHTWLLLGLSPTGTVQSTGTLVGLGLGRAQNGWNQISEGTFFILKHLRFYNSCLLILAKNLSKVHIFWEGHKILQNLHLTFDCSKVQLFWKSLKNLKKSPSCFDKSADLLSKHQNKREISSNFVAFSQCLNFTYSQK